MPLGIKAIQFSTLKEWAANFSVTAWNNSFLIEKALFLTHFLQHKKKKKKKKILTGPILLFVGSLSTTKLLLCGVWVMQRYFGKKKNVWGSFFSWAQPHPWGLWKFLRAPGFGKLDPGWCSCSLKALRWMFGLLERATKEEEGWDDEFSATAQLPFYFIYGPQLQASLHCNNEKCIYIYKQKMSLTYLFSQVKCFVTVLHLVH